LPPVLVLHYCNGIDDAFVVLHVFEELAERLNVSHGSPALKQAGKRQTLSGSSRLPGH
jgi:hypothetical protein